MDDSNKQSGQDPNTLESLEDQGTTVEPSTNGSVIAPDGAPADGQSTGAPAAPPPKPPRRGFGGFKHPNIYLLGFVLLIVIAVIVVIVAFLNGSSKTKNSLKTQQLSQNTLDQLANSNVTVGDPQQVLSVQSNAVFAGQVLVRKDLDIAGKLQVGGSLSLTGITVAGTSAFEEVQISKNLSVAGNSSVQGTLTVQKSLNVNGSGTFNGPVSATQLTASSLQLNGDLTLTHHIVVGGPIPSRSNGSALGSGGTASVSGSDSGGSITINTGGSPAAGCFVTVNFVQKFNTTPHVLITPVGSNAASLNYYVNRSTSNFSVCTANAAPGGRTFGFDYFVLD